METVIINVSEPNYEGKLRHINSAYLNRNIEQLQVTDNCKLFANLDGKLMNNKKTIIVFG